MNVAYWDVRDVPKGTAPDKVLRYKAFNIAKNPKCHRCQRGLALMVYKFFDKKSSRGSVKSDIISNQRVSDLVTRQLQEELHKPIIKKIEKRKV